MPNPALFTYYIKEDGDDLYKPVLVGSESNTYTFTNLVSQKTYNIKVTTSDLIGNESAGLINVVTEDFVYQEGDVTFSNTVWSNKKASVTIINNTEYDMQYKVVPKGEEINLSEGLITISDKNKVIDNLLDGYSIVVRLYDGTNVTTGYATCEIKDNTPPKIIEVTGLTSNWQKEDVILTVNAKDNESGLTNKCYSFDGGNTWQEENYKKYTENTKAIVIKVRDEAGNIATYNTINITNIDKVGPEITTDTNIKSDSITVDITKITDLGVGVLDNPEITYKIAKSEEELKTVTGEKTTNTSKTYDKLTQNTNYYIQIEVSDKLGNITTKILTVSTGSLNASSKDLEISNVTWSNKKASLSITNKSTYKMQYQVVNKGQTFDEKSNWILTDEATIKLSDLNHGDAIYARLTDETNFSGIVSKLVSDEKAPTIEVTGNSTTWTKNNITLKVTAEDYETGLPEKPYSFNGGQTWQAENTKEYSQNTSGIIIMVRDDAGNIATYDTIDITKIDKIGPEITIEQTKNTTKDITIKVSAIDSASGLQSEPLYTYYIKTEKETSYTKVKQTTETTYTYENLKSDTNYTIKVEASDVLGNIGTGIKEISTKNLQYVDGDITFVDNTWSNSKSTVSVKNNKTDFNVEYQIGKNGADIQTKGTWIKITEKEFKINNLEDGDIIYVRLTDDVNSTAGYATLNIKNTSQKTYTIDELAKNTTRANFDILALKTSNNEIRVQIDGEKDDTSLYNYYYKTTNDDEYTLISTNTYGYDPAVITNVKEGVTYQIKATTVSSAGKVSRSKNTATVIALEQADVNLVYADNRTYIDNSKQIDVSSKAGTGTVTPGDTVKTNAGYTITLPEKFKISGIDGEKNEENGAILIDSSGNEYVWIPVNDTIYDGVTLLPESTATASRTYKPMTKKNLDGSYESFIYLFNGSNSYRNTSTNVGVGKSGNREPSLLTANDKDGYTWKVSSLIGTRLDADESNYSKALGFAKSAEFGEYLENSYSNMISSVDGFGGFYVGRYETTYDEQDGKIVVGSKANSKVLSLKNWYELYLYQDSSRYESNPYNSVNSVTSSMIWQSQYDAMLNYILKGNDKGKVTTKVGTQKGQQSNSKQDETDKINNIYDLGSNVYEFTQEANGTNYRIYRGGSYDTSRKISPAEKTSDSPEDKGEGIGSRIALYAKSTKDEIGPSIKITSLTSATNSITVTALATDKESGVESYRYYISENGTNFTLVETSSSNSYTFKGLKSATKYSIRVEAIDKAGNIGDYTDGQKETTSLGSVAKSSIKVVQQSGSNGKGTVQLSLSQNYIDSGYYIEYQIVNAGGTISSTWTKGETVRNLSNGQKVYACLYDGINRSTDSFEYTVSDLEQFEYYVDTKGNSTQNKTVLYTDSNGKTAYIPKGFKVGITSKVNTINNGLVIQDESENEFVWIPVEDVVETDTSKTSTQKAMARYQTGYDGTTANKYYEGILYDFSGTTSTKKQTKSLIGSAYAYMEPRLVTGGSDYSWNISKNSAKGQSYDTLVDFYKYFGFGSSSGVNVFSGYTEFGSYMNQQYTNMVQSVDKYGGFYIGRYETSVSGAVGNKAAIAEVKINKTPINNQNWYKDYYYQDSNINKTNIYYNNSAVTSQMAWGSQWDAVLNWMLKDDNTKSFVTSVTGNHSGTVATTGSYASDFAKNIFDMSSNVTEWVQETGASTTTYRQYRGGYSTLLNATHYNESAASRVNEWMPPTMTTVYTNEGNGSINKNLLGTRMSLYINNEEDVTAPEATIDSVNVGTNNINVKVNAKDEESGILKYVYSLSNVSYESSNFSESDVVKKEEAYSNNYTIEGLTQNQTYYLRVEVVNGNNKSTFLYKEPIKTTLLSVEEGAIVREKVWGKDGNGKIYCSISSSKSNLKDEGYYIQYQIVKKGGTFSVNGTWTKGDTPSGLSVGDTVYLRLFDGINVTSYYMTVPITELETFSDEYTKTDIYEDYDVDESGNKTLVGTAYIPKGFKVAKSSMTKKIANGLVIEDSIGNQYVWVPVKNAVYDGKTSFSASYKPLARYQSGYDTTSKNQYFEGVFYNYSGTNSSVMSTGTRLGQGSWREPSLVTGSTANYSWISVAGGKYDAEQYTRLNGLGITSPTTFGQYMNNNFTYMVQSVAKYGGFYIGRYETSIYTDAGTNDYSKGTIVKSVDNQTPMASIDWYKMYLSQDSNYEKNPYKSNTNVRSEMIWGCQYDATLNFILQGSDKSKVTAITGNHTGSRTSTGQFGNDIMNNIFDLGSNVREWTQEAYGVQYRAGRGGSYNVDDTGSAAGRINNTSSSSYYGIGSRLTLYIRSTET